MNSKKRNGNLLFLAGSVLTSYSFFVEDSFTLILSCSGLIVMGIGFLFLNKFWGKVFLAILALFFLFLILSVPAILYFKLENFTI